MEPMTSSNRGAHMSFREKAQIVAVSVAIALAVAAGFYYYQTGRTANPVAGPDVVVPDDAPILIAGGSFYIGTRPDVPLNSDGRKLYRNEYKVYQIDLTDKDDAATEIKDIVSKEGVVEILYCRLNLLNNCSERRD